MKIRNITLAENETIEHAFKFETMEGNKFECAIIERERMDGKYDYQVRYWFFNHYLKREYKNGEAKPTYDESLWYDEYRGALDKYADSCSEWAKINL